MGVSVVLKNLGEKLCAFAKGLPLFLPVDSWVVSLAALADTCNRSELCVAVVVVDVHPVIIKSMPSCRLFSTLKRACSIWLLG